MDVKPPFAVEGRSRGCGNPPSKIARSQNTGSGILGTKEEQASTSIAVKDTAGKILKYDGEPAGTYYYSTSCGVGTDTSIWHGMNEVPPYIQPIELGKNSKEDLAYNLMDEEAFKEFITTNHENEYENEEGWYRWTYQVSKIDVDHILDVLKNRYEANNKLILTKTSDDEYESMEIGTLGRIRNIEIIKRNPGGIADELLIVGEDNTYKVISELNIRYVLSDGVSKVIRQSKDEVNASKTLPSAFLVIDTRNEEGYVVGYNVSGGGFGHGVGMSQNGAKDMAKAGLTCDDILNMFYTGCNLDE